MPSSDRIPAWFCAVCLCSVWPLIALAGLQDKPAGDTSASDSAKPATQGKERPEAGTRNSDKSDQGDAAKAPPAKTGSGNKEPEKKELEKKEPEKKEGEKKDPENAARRAAQKKEQEKKAKQHAAAKAKLDAATKITLKTGEIDTSKEQAALDFAAQNHPELVTLITPLKTANPKEYQRALKELLRTSERLSGIRTRDAARYELELEFWKAQSQIRLLTARLTMTTDPELELQLREILKKKAEIHVKLLQNERVSLQARLEHLEKEIDRNSQSQSQLVEQEYDRLLKKAAKDKASIAPRSAAIRPSGKQRAETAKPSTTTN